MLIKRMEIVVYKIMNVDHNTAWMESAVGT